MLEVNSSAVLYQEIRLDVVERSKKLSITTAFHKARVEDTIYKKTESTSIIFHTIFDDALLGPYAVLLIINQTRSSGKDL